MATRELVAEPQHSTCNSDAQCLNGGRCGPLHDDDNILQCHCPGRYTGLRCEHYCPLTCQHGGVCHHKSVVGDDKNPVVVNNDPKVDDFECKCLGYFIGDLCTIPYENCRDGRQCLNGGKCHDRRHDNNNSDSGTSTSYCVCPETYFGDLCQYHNHAADNTGVLPPSTDSSAGIRTSTSDQQKSILENDKLWNAIAICIMVVTLVAVVVNEARKRVRYRSLLGWRHEEERNGHIIEKVDDKNKKNGGTILVNVI